MAEDVRDGSGAALAEADVITAPVSGWSFEAGTYDAAKARDYIRTLSPENSAAFLDQIMERALEVQFKPGEEQEILKAVIFKQRHHEQVEVVPGFTIKIGSLDEQDWDWIDAPAVGEEEGSFAHQRGKVRRMIARSVVRVGSNDMPDDNDGRLRYWLGHNRHLVNMVSETVQRFDRKVRSALRNQEALGKS